MCHRISLPVACSIFDILQDGCPTSPILPSGTYAPVAYYCHAKTVWVWVGVCMGGIGGKVDRCQDTQVGVGGCSL